MSTGDMKLYELRISSGKLNNMARALEISSEVTPRLRTSCPPLGCFTTDVGLHNQYIQIFQYDSYAAREAERTNIYLYNPWYQSANRELQDLYDTQESITMRLCGNSIIIPPYHGGFFFLYKYKFSRSSDTSRIDPKYLASILHDFIQKTSLTAVGMWTSELGEELLSTCKYIYIPHNMGKDFVGEDSRDKIAFIGSH